MKLHEFHILSYRKLQNVTLENLNLINVLVGQNNTGKTSVLEAIQLLEADDPIENVLDVVKNREPVRNSRWKSPTPFYALANANPYGRDDLYIGVSAQTEEQAELVSEIKGIRYVDDLYPSEYAYPSDAHYPGQKINFYKGSSCFGVKATIKPVEFVVGDNWRRVAYKPEKTERQLTSVDFRYISPYDIYKGKYFGTGVFEPLTSEERAKIVKMLQVFDSKIVGIDKGIQNGNLVNYLEIEGGKMVPVSSFGDGLKRVLVLIGAMLRSKNSVLLIDEFEVGIHKRAMIDVAKWLVEVAQQQNVQVFLTTHSREAVEALVEAGIEQKLISGYRLEAFENEIICRYYSGERLDELMNQQGINIL